jgi:hypothetical protein
LEIRDDFLELIPLAANGNVNFNELAKLAAIAVFLRKTLRFIVK